MSLLVVLSLSASCSEREHFSQKLKGIDDQIQKTPDVPMLYYRKAQCLINWLDMMKGMMQLIRGGSCPSRRMTICRGYF